MSTALARRPLREFPPSPGRVMLRIAEMGIHLALQRTLKHDLGQPAQQAARPGQRQALGPHPLSQLPHELQIGGLSRIRTLTIIRKGGKVVTIPLAPRTARAIDLAVGERTGGPVFLAADGRRLDWHATYIVAAYVAGAAR